MAIKYRNIRTGRIATVLEPKEAEKAAPNPYLGGKMAVHSRHTIQRMDDSRTWQRVDSEPAPAKKAPAKKAAAKKAAEPEPESTAESGE